MRLRSVISKVQAVITFHNDTDRMVRAIWIDFEGNEVAYSTLEPKSNKQ